MAGKQGLGENKKAMFTKYYKGQVIGKINDSWRPQRTRRIEEEDSLCKQRDLQIKTLYNNIRKSNKRILNQRHSVIFFKPTILKLMNE